MPNPVQILHQVLGIHFKQFNGRFYIAHTTKHNHYQWDNRYLMSGAYREEHNIVMFEKQNSFC